MHLTVKCLDEYVTNPAKFVAYLWAIYFRNCEVCCKTMNDYFHGRLHWQNSNYQIFIRKRTPEGSIFNYLQNARQDGFGGETAQ